MNLLITGAFNATDEQLNMLKNLGCSLFFQKDERGTAECDFENIDAVICNALFLYHDIAQFKRLKYIQLTSAGLDRVPLDEIKARNILLFNAKGVYSIPMAEFALAAVLSLYKHLNLFYDKQRRHIWEKDRRISELCGKTVCIIGSGSVGNECAKRFKAFGTKTVAVDIVKPKADIYDEYFEISAVRSALADSDIVISALPLTDTTREFFNRDLFALFKSEAVFVNISRGALVNENDLICALREKKIAAAVLDVFQNEPLESESALWELENVIITPHNSFVSDKNNERLFTLIYENLKKFVGG